MTLAPRNAATWGSPVLPPDVNASVYAFTACDARSIRYGLGAVRGVGEAAVEALIGERAHGPFASLEDLAGGSTCRRPTAAC